MLLTTKVTKLRKRWRGRKPLSNLQRFGNDILILYLFHCLSDVLVRCYQFLSLHLCLVLCMWQDELLPMVKSKGLSLSFSSESSIEEELKRESTADVITIAVSFLVFLPSRFYVLSWCHLLLLLCLVPNMSLISCLSLTPLLQISYLVMFAYISLALGGAPRLNSFYITSKVW